MLDFSKLTVTVAGPQGSGTINLARVLRVMFPDLNVVDPEEANANDSSADTSGLPIAASFES